MSDHIYVNYCTEAPDQIGLECCQIVVYTHRLTVKDGKTVKKVHSAIEILNCS